MGDTEDTGDDTDDPKPTPALHGLRVLDLTDDNGRFASKLLTEFGADVVRMTTSGSSGRPVTPTDGGHSHGVLDWWYDGGKTRHAVDLDTAEGAETYRTLASRADVIVESVAPGRLAERELDHEHLVIDNPSLVQVSITPFGRTGPRAGWQASDLTLAALGGVASCTGLPDRPLNLWGRQAFNFGGYSAVIAGLAAVRAARVDGRGRHVDVSIHEALTGAIEHIFMQAFYDEELPDLPRIASRQGGLHWLEIYDVVPTADGHAMITPTPSPDNVVAWLVDNGHEAATAFAGLSVEEALADRAGLMACIADHVGTLTGDQVFDAQHHRVALAPVLDIPAVAANPQFAHRSLFTGPPAGPCTMPARIAALTETPSPPPRPPADHDTPLDDLLTAWPPRPVDDAPGGRSLDRPLEGVRVADFTWVLAGPFATRMLGDLGADVVRVQNEPNATLVNLPDFPYYAVWNRSKRTVTLDVKHPDGLSAARRLIESADIVIENFSAGVFASWGLDWETMRSWNPELIYVTMSGCGHDGPWRHVISYAPTVHALTGLTHLTNFEDRGDIGSGFSTADHLAGFAAATSLLAALEARRRTGRGQRIDLAQSEVCAHAMGPAFVQYSATGEPPRPNGNRDGLHDLVPNEIYRADDDRWVAVSVTDDGQWLGLAELVGGMLGEPALADETNRRNRRAEIDETMAAWVGGRSATDAMETLQRAGVPAGVVQNADELHMEDPQHQARRFWLTVEHPIFGPRPSDRFPALFDGEPFPVTRTAPAYLGEHNFEVWGDELGYDVDEVATGMAEGPFQ